MYPDVLRYFNNGPQAGGTDWIGLRIANMLWELEYEGQDLSM